MYNTANKLYTQSLCRASPYLLGVIVGHYLQKYKNDIVIPRAVGGIGWITALSLGFYSIMSTSQMTSKEYDYNVTEAAQYAALSPVTWSFSLAWVIVACHVGFGGMISHL